MTLGRAKASCITTYIGENPPPDDLFLKLDRDQVHVGTEITGKVEYHGKNHVVKVVLDGIETSVVALPNNINMEDDKISGINYLHKHTSEQRVILHEERLMEATSATSLSSSSFGFIFGLPDDLPGTMRCVLDGTDPTLPSQCQIKYTVTASISNEDNDGRKEVCAVVVVLPKREADIPIDPAIRVSIGSLSEALYQTIFDCGADLFFCTGDTATEESKNYQKPLQDQEPMAITRNNFIFLETSKSTLNLSPGQKLTVEIRDWLRLLSGRRKNAVWMMKLTEELQWSAKGRVAHNQRSWYLYANQHELPTTVSPSYDSNPQSLLQIRHELAIFMTTKDSITKEILASTAPIPIRIVSNRSPWDA
ncbi:hypothetical protein IV203_001111 [Nitzschia inconspicua]|uniref:Uncharacterized protein n=1 Tax=Nitzschia inconspicua TaxID=303405 RepID=A0A9K3PQN4_9STRA|nr:hypothetical protein IV203_001111 [Nitzschia inconspicua]